MPDAVSLLNGHRLATWMSRRLPLRGCHGTAGAGPLLVATQSSWFPAQALEVPSWSFAQAALAASSLPQDGGCLLCAAPLALLGGHLL